MVVLTQRIRCDKTQQQMHFIAIHQRNSKEKKLFRPFSTLISIIYTRPKAFSSNSYESCKMTPVSYDMTRVANGVNAFLLIKIWTLNLNDFKSQFESDKLYVWLISFWITLSYESCKQHMARRGDVLLITIGSRAISTWVWMMVLKRFFFFKKIYELNSIGWHFFSRMEILLTIYTSLTIFNYL